MKERIKKLRKSVSLTQTEFGARIGVKGSTITNYESGLRHPSDATILSICREFGVNEAWLRTGEGDMFVALTRREEMAALFGSILGGQDPLRERFISALAEAKPEQLQAILEVAQKLAAEPEE